MQLCSILSPSKTQRKFRNLNASDYTESCRQMLQRRYETRGGLGGWEWELREMLRFPIVFWSRNTKKAPASDRRRGSAAQDVAKMHARGVGRGLVFRNKHTALSVRSTSCNAAHNAAQKESFAQNWNWIVFSGARLQWALSASSAAQRRSAPFS